MFWTDNIIELYRIMNMRSLSFSTDKIIGSYNPTIYIKFLTNFIRMLGFKCSITWTDQFEKKERIFHSVLIQILCNPSS